VPLHVLNFAFFARRLRERSEGEQRERGRLGTFLLESIEGWAEVRSNYLGRHFRDRGERLVQAMNAALLARRRLGLQQQHVQAALVVVNHVAVIAFGGHQVAAGHLRVGTLFFFFLLLESFYSPIYRFSAVNSALQAACVKIERLAEFIEHRALEPRGASSAPLGAVSTLSVRGLSYAGLFRDLNYRFERNRLYFIGGPSGCGKTTLLMLLARLRAPTAGSVWLDDEDTTGWPVSRLRRCVQGAPQESVVFQRSVARNIHHGDPDPPDEARVRRAAYHAAADLFIAQLPFQYDHELSADGGNLSGGERQRIHLARFFYHDAPVLLLDEPTAALDLATEKVFFERLRELRASKIILVVNHREQALRYADVMLTLTPTGLVEERPPVVSAAAV
jgi:ABC-type bacteriocin/lantibiotic exporter with double-glycine peptidase domain